MPWIDPLWHLVTAIGRYTFYIRRDGCPLSGREIDKLLSAHGIGHHGMNLDLEGDIGLNVNKDQAGRAQQLFDQYGVEVLNPYNEGKPRTGPSSQSRKAPERQRGMPRTSSPFSVWDIFDT